MVTACGGAGVEYEFLCLIYIWSEIDCCASQVQLCSIRKNVHNFISAFRVLVECCASVKSGSALVFLRSRQCLIKMGDWPFGVPGAVSPTYPGNQEPLCIKIQLKQIENHLSMSYIDQTS